MQFSTIYTIIALGASMVAANPVADPEMARSLAARGIDLCPPQTHAIGQSCSFGGGDDSPHACSSQEGPAILHCVNGKWALERRCGGGKTCGCTSQKDIICRL